VSALTEGRSVEPGVLAALVEAVRAARGAAGTYGVQLKGARSPAALQEGGSCPSRGAAGPGPRGSGHLIACKEAWSHVKMHVSTYHVSNRFSWTSDIMCQVSALPSLLARQSSEWAPCCV